MFQQMQKREGKCHLVIPHPDSNPHQICLNPMAHSLASNWSTLQPGLKLEFLQNHDVSVDVVLA